MKLILAGMLLAFLPSMSLAQQRGPVQTTASDGAVLRALDMANGVLSDIEVQVGEMAKFERLEITLVECRYPTELPESDGYALLKIRDIREDVARFDGWMVASSPALSALDHPRYDVWVLRCSTPVVEAEGE